MPVNPTSTRSSRVVVPVADLTNAFASVFAAVALAVVAAYTLVPDLREWIGGRGGLVPWMTTATLVGALGAGVWAYRRSTDETNFRLLLPITAGVLLAQNVRFGADAIGYPLPTVSGVEIGSLVDIREVMSLTAERLGLGFTTAILVLGIVVAITAASVLSARRWADQRVLVTEAPVVTWFVLALGAAATVPALGMLGEGTGAWFVTGMAGLVSAGCLVAACMSAGDHRRTVAGWRRRIWPWIADEGPLTGIPSDS